MSRRRARDRGAVLMETAVVVVLLAAMLLGISEYGFAWRQGTVLEKAVQAGGRAAGSGADQPFADFQALEAFEAALSATRLVEVDLIVIYRSTTADGAMDPDCRTASKANVCNRYTAADLARPPADFGCGAGEPDRFWCPTTRDRTRNPTGDYVGMYVEATYTGLTKLLPDGIDLTRSAVFALEPCAFGLPGC